MESIFFTGFPGFLGVELLPKVLKRFSSDTKAYCLIQKKYMAYAKKKMREIENNNHDYKDRIKLVEGDITLNDLGLGKASHIKGSTVEIYHLAAVYDLSVSKELAERVNVTGTKNVLEFASRCKKLKRFQYVSTCYVSGNYNGLFRENDLDVGQKFHNHYEETKFRAELLVREAESNGLPTTIYRPSIVMGDSTTGETQKYDGPYYVIQWLLRLPKVFIFPDLAMGKRYRFNMIPRDFLVDAIAYLSGEEKSQGKIYQLCDPRPMKVGMLVDVLGKATGRKLFKIPLPAFLAKWAVNNVKPLGDWIRIPADSMDYFSAPMLYSAENMIVDLKGSGISCPPFVTYVDNLVSYMKEHGEISSRPMV